MEILDNIGLENSVISVMKIQRKSKLVRRGEKEVTLGSCFEVSIQAFLGKEAWVKLFKGKKQHVHWSHLEAGHFKWTHNRSTLGGKTDIYNKRKLTR